MWFELTPLQQSLRNSFREFAKAMQAVVDKRNRAIQFHGTLGYLAKHHIERYHQDVELLTIADGLNERQENTHANATVDQQGEWITCR
ncbi:acyl-CoA dehydrogenase [Haloarcula sp. CBA1131]|uniref:acyl-CoA dehydrogenase family protein n=1 Tax=Haloarcula sp. CBA1131 TaxID=1853686 RepID=UPI0012457775|nr:acyl-CoA dehydrogenase [Haloarcula sp. CBA1131]